MSRAETLLAQIRIRVNGNATHLGYFDDEAAAARTYDAAARENFGTFASVNFPEPGERGAARN